MSKPTYDHTDAAKSPLLERAERALWKQLRFPQHYAAPAARIRQMFDEPDPHTRIGY